ncbi:hypothetical protein [Eubacterium barkeri]|uniref:Uncharacterized protein n=1 Tax=Eubacterium barkeri TaxID=1528 RepID=A0A1H3BHA0_EUBBA|nr:hypothetical protein [Eubacterium barkeri]SDX41081.1 hypothetical protein SAMN04488579_10273 [Eubacterium barkeri]
MWIKKSVIEEYQKRIEICDMKIESLEREVLELDSRMSRKVKVKKFPCDTAKELLCGGCNQKRTCSMYGEPKDLSPQEFIEYIIGIDT